MADYTANSVSLQLFLTRKIADLAVERKTTVFTHNAQAVASHTRKTTSETRDLWSKLDDFHKACTQSFASVQTRVEQYRTKEPESLAAISARAEQQMEKIQENHKLIRAKEEALDDAIRTFNTTMQGMWLAWRLG